MSTPRPSGPSRRVIITSTAVGAPLIGLAIAASAIVPTLQASPVAETLGGAPAVTEVSALSATVQEGVSFNDTHWVIPVDASWASFPMTPGDPPGTYGCTDAQLDWLEDAGDRIIEPAQFTLANQATAGQNLSMNNIRLEGEQVTLPPSIRVDCEATGGGNGGVQLVVADLTAGAGVSAVVDPGTDQLEGSDVEYIPGDQVVFNLRPGDTALLFLYLTAAIDGTTFRGDLVATVTSGDQERDVTLPRMWGDQLVIPQENVKDFVVHVMDGKPQCGTPDESGFLDFYAPYCTGSQIAARLRGQAAGGSGEPTVAPDLVGTWTGDVLGDYHPYSVTATLRLAGNVLVGDVSYPEIPCAATWTQTGSPGGTLTFTETIPSQYVCYNNVPVTLTPQADGTMSYSALSGGVTITSTLSRIG